MIASGLIYGTHTTIITVTGNKGGAGAASDALVRVYGFDVLSTTDAALKYATGEAFVGGTKTTVATAGTLAALTASGSAPYRRDLVVLDKGATAPRAVTGTAGSTSDTLAQFQAKNKVAFRVEAEDTSGKLANVWATATNSFSSSTASGGVALYIGSMSSSYSDTSGTDYLIVGFIGTGLDMIYPSGPNNGIMAVSVDGGAETNVDAYSASSIAQVRVNVAKNLAYGYHQVKVRKTGTRNASSGAYTCPVDAFDVYHPIAPATPVDSIALAEVDVTPSNGWIRYDDAAGWVYTGSNWVIVTGAPYTGGALRQNANTNTTDKATFVFEGTQFRIITTNNNQNGKYNVSIDGGADTLVDCYGSIGIGVTYTSPVLSAGVHTVTITMANAKNASSGSTVVNLDSIDVLPLPVQVRDVRNLAPVDFSVVDQKITDAMKPVQDSVTAVQANVTTLTDQLSSAGNYVVGTNLFKMKATYPSTLNASVRSAMIAAGGYLDVSLTAGQTVYFDAGYQISRLSGSPGNWSGTNSPPTVFFEYSTDGGSSWADASAGTYAVDTATATAGYCNKLHTGTFTAAVTATHRFVIYGTGSTGSSGTVQMWIRTG